MKINIGKICSLTCHSNGNIKRKSFLFLMFSIAFSMHAQKNSFQKVGAFKEFKNHTIKAITQDKFNNIWFATNRGLLKFNGVLITPSKYNLGESSQNVNTIFVASDSLFIGKNKSLHIKTRQQLLTFGAKRINKILKHGSNYFIASAQGILHINKNYLQALKITHNLDFAPVNDLVFYKNEFIVAANNGLWSASNILQPKKITLMDSGNYSSLLQIENRLFVVKNNSEIQELTLENRLLKRYTKNEISNISFVNNKVYVGSKNEGIDVLNAATFTFEKRINKYNSNLNSNTINAVFQDAEKNVFIATKNQLYIKKNKSIVKKPSLEIIGLKVNYKAIDSINLNSYKKVLQLKPNQNNISFSLQSVSISTPENIEFRYKLNEISSPWSANNQINFANLNSGKYELHVASRFKNSSEITAKKFSFFIDTAIYNKSWFLILCGVLFCLLFLGILTLKSSKLNQKNQQKIAALKLQNHLLSLEQKALQLQMNPHFIFNVLNGIKALGNLDSKKELHETIAQFSILLRSVLNNSRLEEISLKEEVETLENYLALEQQMNSKKFTFSIEHRLHSINAEEILIPPMLLQPFIENAIKHGISKIIKQGEIKIIFEIKNRFLECSILDNGIGFYQSQNRNTFKKHTSVAIKITKERIENLSTYSAFSAEELTEDETIVGTKIWFKIPLKTDY
jgi:two-component system sensor histidine kinase LytS